MNTTINQRYGPYRFGSSQSLTDEHLTQLTSVFNTSTQGRNKELEGRVPASALGLKGIGSVIVKHYRRGGLLGHFVKRTYLRCGNTRCQAEYSQLENARRLGINAPEPIAYAYKGYLFYQAWLITREIINQQSLASLSSLDPGRAEAAKKVLLKQILLLQDKHIFHTDLHPGNVLVDDTDRVFIIDFDKAVKFKGNKQQLQMQYHNRWNRAVSKHRLPEILYIGNQPVHNLSASNFYE